ncbi:MAG: caspase family protein [Pseudomonadales bacterium]|jgi:TPR repeat protein|tara:strand:- start:2107 stop:4590 length:2484 start_codon:yes stop_codon:yes gene_type:complete
MGPRIIFLIAFLMLVPDALSASRGISVQLRASESKNAELVGEFRMYSESYALVVGIDEYTQGWPKLSNAVKDAELIAEALEEKGFEVDLHTNLDSAELMQVFKRFFILKGERPNARLFVWFAGHGATVDGEGYLVPADAPVLSEGADFKFASLALRDFGTYMRQSGSKHVYAVFDSCFAGTVFSSQRAMPPAAITRATTLPVRQFLTSGDADQTVSDDGQFRDLFLRAIRGEDRSDANADGYLTASELGMYLGDRVTNLTESAQTPRYGKLRDRDFDRGDFVFALPTAPLTGSDESSRGNEIVFWNLIKDTGSRSEYSAYLSQFPNGQFAPQALLRQRQLQQSANLNLPRGQFLQAGSFDFKPINRDLVTVEQTAVRAVPDMASDIVGQLAAGTNVWGLGEYKSLSGDWFDISHSGVRLGFVSVEQLQPTEQTDRFVLIDNSEDQSDSSRLDDQLSQMMYRLLDAPAEMDSVLAVNESGSEESAMTLLASGALVQEPEPAVNAEKTAAADAFKDRSAALEIIQESTGIAATIDIADTDASIERSQAPQLNAQQQTLDATPEAKVQAKAPGHDDGGLSATVQSEVSVPESPSDSVDPSLSEKNEVVAADQPEDKEVSGQQETELSGGLTVAAKDAGRDAAVPVEKAVTVDKDTTVRVEQRLGDYARRYLKAASKGDIQAQFYLGYMYENGEHVVKDLLSAKKWYRDAAEMAHVKAMIRLASLLGEDPEATDWFRKAAEKGDAGAQTMIAFRYESGTGTEINLDEAVVWYTKAAEQDQIVSQVNLGRLYHLGIGVEKNVDQAIFWYEKAAEQGNEPARNRLEQLRPNPN